MIRVTAAVLLAVVINPMASAEIRRFGVIIGNNLGRDPASKLRYAEQDAQKFRQVLLELGGFQPDDLRILLGGDEAQAWRALRETERKMSGISGSKMFLFFYSGHADGDFLELGGSSLRYADLKEFLMAASADLRIAFVDSCKSGKLLASKGGHLGPAYTIQVTEEIASKGFAIVTSSAGDELSQESAEIRGSFFTHYLVSALRGAGDSTADGRITLQEAYRFAYSRTVARTSTTIGGSQHPMYDFDLSGKDEIVLTQTSKAASRLAVLVPMDSRLVVLAGDASSVVAETEIPASRRALLALAPGTYQVFLASGDDIRKAVVSLLGSEEKELDVADFVAQTLEVSVPKGGLFPQPWRKQIQGGFVLRRMPLAGTDVSLGTSLVIRILSPKGLQPVARLTWTKAVNAADSSGYFDLDALAGVGFVWTIGELRARVEALCGYEHLFQDKLGSTERDSAGIAYLAMSGLELAAGEFLISLDGGVGGRVFQLRSEGWIHRLDLQLFFGLGWMWGG